MKLLLLVAPGGDAQRRLVPALVEAARARGDDVRVLAPDAAGKRLRPLGVPVESWQPAGLFNELGSIGALRRAADHHAPDAIHAVGWTAAAVALGALPAGAAARTLVTLLDPIHEGELPKKFVEQRLPELLRRAGCTTCAYPSLARTLVERFGVDPARVELLPYGVRPRLPQGYARPAGRAGPIVGYLVPPSADHGWAAAADHGWAVAVDALAALAAALPDARLYVEQAGPLRGQVRAYGRERGLRHEVACFDDLPLGESWRGVDLVLVPAGREGLPWALPQALVDGVPVVAADREGLADTLGPYPTGWLVRDDPAGFAGGIAAAWAGIDAAWAGAQAQRAAASAAFDPAALAARTAALYARLAASLAPGEEAGSPVGQPGERA